LLTESAHPDANSAAQAISIVNDPIHFDIALPPCRKTGGNIIPFRQT